ncbi:hypothetical protein ABIA23_004586 [Sinorhizobium fredii]
MAKIMLSKLRSFVSEDRKTAVDNVGSADASSAELHQIESRQRTARKLDEASAD